MDFHFRVLKEVIKRLFLLKFTQFNFLRLFLIFDIFYYQQEWWHGKYKNLFEAIKRDEIMTAIEEDEEALKDL